MPVSGFVGVGRVISGSEPATTFTAESDGAEVPVLDVAKRATYHRNLADDLEHCEYFVRVHWLQTVPLEDAVRWVMSGTIRDAKTISGVLWLSEQRNSSKVHR